MTAGILWSVITALQLTSSAMMLYGFSRTGRVFALLFGMGFLFLGVGFSTFAIARLTVVTHHDILVTTLNRGFFTAGLLNILLAADAYLASTNGHWSLVATIMRPLERRWKEQYG